MANVQIQLGRVIEQVPADKAPKGAKIQLAYCDSDGQQTLRRGTVDDVKPWGIIVLCDDRKDYRAFRFDRIV